MDALRQSVAATQEEARPAKRKADAAKTKTAAARKRKAS